MIKSNSSYFNIRTIGLTLIVAVIYFILCEVVLLLAFKNIDVTPVWIASGIALAAMLLLGSRVWFGILLGAFGVNLLFFLSNKTIDTNSALWTSLFVSIGNTAEAVFGFYLLHKASKNIIKFEKVKHVFKFISIILIMCLTGAVVCSTTLCLSNTITWNQYLTTLFIWWLNDIDGVLIVTPLLLAWVAYINIKWKWDKKMLEVIFLYLFIFSICIVAFSNLLPANFIFIKSYFIFPFLLWTAFYFELRVVLVSIALFSGVAIYGTVNGNGSFVSDSITETLLSLQLYISMISISILILKAAITEREQSEKALQNSHDKLLMSVKEQSDELNDYQERVNAIFKSLLKYTVMDFSQKIPISGQRDEIDAIATGLNTLGEELEFSTSAQMNYAKELELTNRLLIDSEQQIKNIFDNAPDSVIVIDAESTILKWNPQAESTFGWQVNDVIGKPLHEFIIPVRYRQAHLKGMKHFFENRNGLALNKNFEIEAINKQGVEFPVSLSISPVMMEGEYMFIGFVRNVSEQKKAEKKVKELAAIVESSDDAIISQSMEGIILSWNKAAEIIYGYSADEVIGKSISITTPSLQIDELVKIPERLKQGELLINFDTQKVKKDGTLIYVSLTASAIKDNGGNIIAISLISRDITESKKNAAEMVRITEELKRSNAELEQFAYVASHDLQEPLRMVTSYLQLLEKRYKDKLDQDANEFIGFAVDGSNRMRTLIHSLLDYSRINRIKPFEWVDVNILLDDVFENLKTRISENDAVIKVNELPKIFADYVLINQLFQNLISNAIKFRSAKTPEIIISGRKIKNEYLFSVKDNGIGIQQEYSEKIFVIFQRLHSKEKYSGTGMGLAICKKIVERHGGRIWIKSEIDKGSTFYFTIKEKE